MKTPIFLFFTTLLVSASALAQNEPKAQHERVGLELLQVKGEVLSLKDNEIQRDFPAATVDSEGQIWVTYIEHDGEADLLRLAKKTKQSLEPVAAMSEAGILHQPAIAVAGDGTAWCFWGQTGEDDVVHLYGRPFSDGEPGEQVVLAKQDGGSDSFAHAGTGSEGRVWVVWQSMRAGEGDIYARYLEDGDWSEEIAVTTEKMGDWEPRVSFDDAGNAWVLYDSSRGNEFNLYLAKVSPAGEVKTHEIAHSEAYEGRADFCRTADGKGFWIAAERGRVRWGLDVRGHGNDKGLNAQKRLVFGRFDLDSGEFSEIPLGDADKIKGPVNLPAIGLDAKGNPWVAYRYFDSVFWGIAVTRYDLESSTWSKPVVLEDSTMGQDRRADFVQVGEDLWLTWPSDLRTSKKCLVSGVFLAQVDTSVDLVALKPGKLTEPGDEPYAKSQETPERPPDDRHTWKLDGTDYGLYWGDLHRHTDVSNCRTGFDGCIVEQFRYAYDMAKLDFLGTSDHTDIGKIYDPYEWWHNQRLADVFHSPRQFNSLYVYEREQRWPWGHRNVVFAERGGPIVYIKRANYRNSPWQKLYPVKPGIGEISPDELWKVLRASGKKVGIVSHTGATGMGTDWSGYEQIDYAIENLVEIYQGARVSYEGKGAPQPTAGLRPKEGYTPATGGKTPKPPAPIEDFGKYDAGVYQNALAQGHKLGIFCSSDHISQHVSYGGVYVKEFTREGILEAFSQRRTMAATDKIYVEFSCNGKPMGSIFEMGEKPEFSVKVDGTAPIERVTIVKNEEDWRHFEGGDAKVMKVTAKDDEPVEGENRYYLRVQQVDGNMAWASPVWVTYAP